MPLALVGFIDDFRNLSPVFRFLVQCATSVVLIYISPLPFSVSFLPFFVLGITGLINFTNFMDGADGLLAGCMVLALCTLSISLELPWTVWTLVGSLFGFLFGIGTQPRFSWVMLVAPFLEQFFFIYPSGIFLAGSARSPCIDPIFADAFICVVRRLISGHSIFQAHRLHLYQRIHQAGFSHSFISLIYICGTLITSIAFLSGGFSLVLIFAIVELLFGIWLDRTLAVPFSIASTR